MSHVQIEPKISITYFLVFIFNAFMQIIKPIVTIVGIFSAHLVTHAQPKTPTESVGITKSIQRIEIKTPTRNVVIQREQDPLHTIEPPFDKTSRACPPFCIQPITAAPGVETLGELELIEFLQKTRDDRIMIIDTRLPEWYQRGTIPLAVNFPSESFSKDLSYLLEKHLGAKKSGNQWDYTNAKTLVLFCNGYWNPDSYEAIKQLIAHGYPAEKLKWYRGGMQSWLSLGLTTEKPQ